MSPGLTERPEGQILGRADHARDPDRQAERGDRADGLEHRRAARHVELHLVHLRRGLDRDPARVERHRLADEPQQRPGDVRRLVAQRDQPGVLVGAAGDARERAHARGLDAFAVEHLDAHAVERLRALGQRARREHVRRPVLQVTRGVDRGRHGRGLRGGRAHVVVGGQHQRAEAAVLGGLELAIAVGRQQRPLDQRADVRVGDVVRDLPAQRLGPQLLGARHHARGGHARPLGIEVAPGAEAGDDVAAPVGVRHGQLAQPPSRLARIDQRLQDAAVIVRDPLVLEDADGDRVGARGGRGLRAG